MGEAEKIDILSVPETPAASEQETINPADNFYLLAALIDRKGFDLRGKVKRSKSIDKQVKEEMLGYIDEALGVITNFKREGASNKLVNEAVDCFNILQEMGEKYIPEFEKKQTKYNGKIEAAKPAPKEEQPIKLAEKISDSEKPEQEKKPDDDKNKKAGKESPSAEPLAEQNNKKNMKEKIEEVSASRTMQEQLAANKDKIEKAIVSKSPDNAADSTKKPKEDRVKIVDVAGEPRKATEEKIAGLEKKLEMAYKKSKNRDHEYELAQPIRNEIFKAIEEQYPNWKPEKIREETAKVIEKTKDQVRGEEKERREKEKERKEKQEDLKKKLEETYKTFYEDYINKGEEAPKKITELLASINQELFSLWPAWQRDGKGRQKDLADFNHDLKTKYRVDPQEEATSSEDKREKAAEVVEKKDLSEAEPTATDKPVFADESEEKPADKKTKLRPAAKSKIIIGEDFSSARDESQQEESKKFREELEKQKEEQTRFENIQEKMKKRKLIAVEDAKFAQDYLVREQKRKTEAEKKIAARVKAEEAKPALTAPKTEKMVTEKAEAKREKPSVPERKTETGKTVEAEELDAKAARDAKAIALMERYGIKSLEDLKKMGF